MRLCINIHIVPTSMHEYLHMPCVYALISTYPLRLCINIHTFPASTHWYPQIPCVYAPISSYSLPLRINMHIFLGGRSSIIIPGKLSKAPGSSKGVVELRRCCGGVAARGFWVGLGFWKTALEPPLATSQLSCWYFFQHLYESEHSSWEWTQVGDASQLKYLCSATIRKQISVCCRSPAFGRLMLSLFGALFIISHNFR